MGSPSGPRRVVLIVEYDGTPYYGFQLQPDRPTVQGTLEQALKGLTGHYHRIAAASRTDTGVHAAGQVVSLLPQTDLPLSAYVGGLNARLPHTIAVVSAFFMPAGFDVRRHALSRVYRYTILNRRTPSPLWRDRAALVREPLDTVAMAAAARLLEGTHDFSAFARPQEPHVRTVRTMDRAELCRREELVFLEIEGRSFLPQQVRRTAGALVLVGSGRMSRQQFEALLASGKPGAAHWTLPPQGLCLLRVSCQGFPPEPSSSALNEPVEPRGG
ncbi:MAG: tRNA pseudouridine(38-40) synthase TruA [Chloroflexi bacterium]|nr:tRNA pseudouridine(38-40) synthase TruA [Chloroflexota bacterium]